MTEKEMFDAFNAWYSKRWLDDSGRLFTRRELREAFYAAPQVRPQSGDPRRPQHHAVESTTADREPAAAAPSNTPRERDWAGDLFEARRKSGEVEWAIYEKLCGLFGEDAVSDNGCDEYDWSLEVYMTDKVPANWACSDLQRDVILSWGFSRFWINFSDDTTEQYCAVGVTGKRGPRNRPPRKFAKREAPTVVQSETSFIKSAAVEIGNHVHSDSVSPRASVAPAAVPSSPPLSDDKKGACRISEVESPVIGKMLWCETHGIYFGLNQSCPYGTQSAVAPSIDNRLIEACAVLAECADPDDGRDHGECPFCTIAGDIRKLKGSEPQSASAARETDERFAKREAKNIVNSADAQCFRWLLKHHGGSGPAMAGVGDRCWIGGVEFHGNDVATAILEAIDREEGNATDRSSAKP